MRGVFGDDHKRIDHALAVLGRAEEILAGEPRACGLIVRAAAILHDIGIRQAEAKHGSAAGKYQEIEGPPIARKMLEDLKIPGPELEHICRIIANHHSARDIDTVEFRIIWDADWLVNIPEEYDTTDQAEMARLTEKIFKTRCGKKIAEQLFCERNLS
jgi:hypothetical protein